MVLQKFIKYSLVLFILVAVLYRGYLYLLQFFSTQLIPAKDGFIGPTPLANFDGYHHYLVISKFGYQGFQQAFFPVYPLLIRGIADTLSLEHFAVGLAISFVASIFALYFFWKLVRLDYDIKTAKWALAFFIAFPTFFFLFAVYTESLFLTFLFASFYFMRRAFIQSDKKNKGKIKTRFLLLSALSGAVASATRFVGIFIIPAFLVEYWVHIRSRKNKFKTFELVTLWPALLLPLGTILYMIYLQIRYNDALFFIHAQPAFGANRSGGEIILLPQVAWRYIKIFMTVPINSYDFWIALSEFATVGLVLLLLFWAYKKGIRKSYILFSVLVVILPTLSGTFSSIMRYSLSAFVIFILFATIKNSKIKYAILITGFILQLVFASLFMRGYFVS